MLLLFSKLLKDRRPLRNEFGGYTVYHKKRFDSSFPNLTKEIRKEFKPLLRGRKRRHRKFLKGIVHPDFLNKAMGIYPKLTKGDSNVMNGKCIRLNDVFNEIKLGRHILILSHKRYEDKYYLNSLKIHFNDNHYLSYAENISSIDQWYWNNEINKFENTNSKLSYEKLTFITTEIQVCMHAIDRKVGNVICILKIKDEKSYYKSSKDRIDNFFSLVLLEKRNILGQKIFYVLN